MIYQQYETKLLLNVIGTIGILPEDKFFYFALFNLIIPRAIFFFLDIGVYVCIHECGGGLSFIVVGGIHLVQLT